MRPCAMPKNTDLSLLEKVRSLACKAWKMLGQLRLWIKPLASLLGGAVPKREFGAVPGGHVDGAAGIWDAVWQQQNGLGHALGTRELLIGAENRKATVGMDKSHPGKNEG